MATNRASGHRHHRRRSTYLSPPPFPYLAATVGALDVSDLPVPRHLTSDSPASPERRPERRPAAEPPGVEARTAGRLYRQGGKRILDLALVVCGLPVVIPLALLLAIVVRVALGAPVLFVQRRPGLGGRPFAMWKFRTMTDARDATGALLSDADRLTPLGRFLRSSSLDEIPELWNVLRGEMTLVGPRPLLPEYMTRYSPRQLRRHEVRPGITGWAQVNGRNALAWAERFERDVWYVEHCSLALDCRILWMTARKVLAREGISQQGEVTMLPFLGNSPERHER